MKICTKCLQPIPEARLKALPSATTCVKCSTTAKVAGHSIITGKTTYSELQIVTAEKSEELANLQNRKGYGVSEGVKTDADKNKPTKMSE